jgi:hypothetical protein
MGGKEAQRQGEDRVTLLITLLCGGFAHPLKIRVGFYAREGPQYFLVFGCLSLGSTTLVSRHFKAKRKGLWSDPSYTYEGPKPKHLYQKSQCYLLETL